MVSNWVISIMILDVLILFLYQIAGFLDVLSWKKEIPVPFRERYSAEEYERARIYAKTKFWFNLFEKTFFAGVVLFFIFSGLLLKIDKYLKEIFTTPFWHSMAFFTALILFLWILNLPFNYYFTFYIEEKFGFNKSTRRLFFRDEFVSLLLSLVFFFLIGSAAVYLFYFHFELFPWLAWGIVVTYNLIFSLFYSQLIVPLFNKQKPLENEDLKENIQQLFQSVGFDVKDVYVIDSSKRTNRANAYFTGWGKKKRIVLFDNLLNLLTPQEVLAVLLHELGHFKYKHTLISFFVSIVYTGFVFFAFHRSVGWVNQIFNIETSFHFTLFGFMLIFYPLYFLLEILILFVSRQFEYAADAFAFRYGKGEELAGALVKLTSNHLGNLHPHLLKVLLYYSHPPVLHRIRHIVVTKESLQE